MNEDSLMRSLRNNSVLMEQLTDMGLNQVGKEKVGYVDFALEAIAGDSQSVVFEKLFKELQKIEDVNFGHIPDTKGDITKYPYYGQINDIIELINSQTKDGQYPNVVTMNKLHQILLDARGDFVFGFKTNNILITSTYKCMYATLIELTNICIVDMTSHLRKKISTSMLDAGKGKTNALTVVKCANQFITLYESGQWSTMMKSFRSGKAFEAIENIEGELALEDINLSATITTGDSLWSKVKEIPGKIGSLPGQTWDLAKSVWNKGVGGKAVIVVALLGILRLLIYAFMQGAAKLKDCLRNNAQILKASMAAEDPNTPDDAIEKQKKMLNRMEKTADFIEYTILKREKDITKEVARNDREFSPSDIRNSTITSGGFEF